ncbi:hypothetical protein [Actinomadura mexicana]|uniref:Uncharacterized protein n=1 Tax=Actinomadura mexicana TaxID=134959 RepID=A0A238Y4C5_9ACTN|nr:hypothetical protein [Actinomadura mexicana]SNR65832.1 hypothetical protein SAMN06265355_105224 [Actinomadura mexicana]
MFDRLLLRRLARLALIAAVQGASGAAGGAVITLTVLWVGRHC